MDHGCNSSAGFSIISQPGNCFNLGKNKAEGGRGRHASSPGTRATGDARWEWADRLHFARPSGSGEATACRLPATR